MIPKRVHSVTNPPREQLARFFSFATTRCEQEGLVSTVFIPLISVPPHQRLARNLRVMLDRMSTTQIRNVLEDGLLNEERDALLELELREASDELLSVAHGLLNVHERWFLLKSVGSKFRAANEKNLEFIQPSELLGDLLGDT